MTVLLSIENINWHPPGIKIEADINCPEWALQY